MSVRDWDDQLGGSTQIVRFWARFFVARLSPAVIAMFHRRCLAAARLL
jgi:hypothetical protein